MSISFMSRVLLTCNPEHVPTHNILWTSPALLCAEAPLPFLSPWQVLESPVSASVSATESAGRGLELNKKRKMTRCHLSFLGASHKHKGHHEPLHKLAFMPRFLSYSHCAGQWDWELVLMAFSCQEHVSTISRNGHTNHRSSHGYWDTGCLLIQRMCLHLPLP